MNIKPRIFVVDDQIAILKALKRLLNAADFDVETFESAQEFLDSGNIGTPGCIVLDLSMPGMTGMMLQQALVQRESLLPIIFLSGHGDIDTSVQAMKLGAADFLTKPVDDEKLIGAVRAAFEKNRLANSNRVASDDLQQLLASLTPREREVLMLVTAGKLNKQIADVLGTVEKTIKVHRARVMAKMKVRSLAELVRLADRAGILRSSIDK
jgi:RNA polymerase sigma factor (sigma-70 family)